LARASRVAALVVDSIGITGLQKKYGSPTTNVDGDLVFQSRSADTVTKVVFRSSVGAVAAVSVDINEILVLHTQFTFATASGGRVMRTEAFTIFGRTPGRKSYESVRVAWSDVRLSR
jgi:hypothetical protein